MFCWFVNINNQYITKRHKARLANSLLHCVFDTLPLNYIPKMTRNFAKYLVKCFFNCTFVAKSLRIFFLARCERKWHTDVE